MHVRSRHPNALPLIMTHGSPGSIFELMKVIGPLTDPTAYGGRAEDAFDLVLPTYRSARGVSVSSVAMEHLQRRTSNRTNLLLHIVAVPLFMSATLLAVYALVGLSLPALAAAALCFMVSLIIQGRGHKLESILPEPFKSGLDFILRLFAEQWITFPRFVLTGGWFENLSKAEKKADFIGR